MAVGPKDGDGAGEEHRTEVSYQVTRWSNTYSGARGGMSSQWNWDDRPRSRGCTWVYEIAGKLKCPKADTRERQVGVDCSRSSDSLSSAKGLNRSRGKGAADQAVVGAETEDLFMLWNEAIGLASRQEQNHGLIDSTHQPLRQRMIDDMRMRKLADKTQHHYIRAVRQFAGFLGRSPDTASVEDLRRYQLHLVDRGISPVSLNAAITGLKFFFEVTLDHGELMYKMQPVRVPRTLPVVLSREEVARLIAAAGNLKHQTALSVAYGAGLRASEVVALKVGDIDSARMTLRIEQGKGGKDRYAMLSPVLLERLRAWWRVARAQGKMLDGGWLFPGLNPIESLSTRQLNRAVHAAAKAAKIDKRVSMHTLRHCFATHLLEQKVDIRVIQVLLGHKKLETTALYAQVATEILREVVSPLETMAPA